MPAISSKILNIALWVLLGLGVLYAALHWVLPWLWPFLVAFAAAAALEPAVGYLCRRGLKRGLAAGVAALVFLIGLLGLLWLLFGRAAAELGELAPRLPEIFSGVADTLRSWRDALEGWIANAPEGLAAVARSALDGAVDSLARLPGDLAGKLPGLVSAIASAAPTALLFATAVLIGTYFISASYPELLHGAAKLLPDRFLCRARLLRRDLRQTLGRWLRAQGLMSLITTGIVAAALLLLGVPYALLLALAVGAVDALPVFGAGTVLVPWAVYALLTGDTPLGVGLAVTYGTVSLLRSLLQAKLLGDQLGLHPLVTLIALCAGWQLWGVWGMLLFPLLAICLKQALPGLTAWREGAEPEPEPKQEPAQKREYSAVRRSIERKRRSVK